MATDFVFPEDDGTCAAGGDNVDAANFATLAFRGDHRNQQVVPVTFTPDFGAGTLDISEGLMLVSDESAQESQTTEVRDQGLRYAAIYAGASGVSIGSSDREAIWLDIDLSVDDTINLIVQDEDSGTAPTKPSLKVGVVDNVNEVVYQVNTEPESRSRSDTVRNYIRPGEVATVPEEQTQISAGLDVDGEVDVQGELLSVAENPTPKRHDHRGNDIIPRTSATDLSVESWESVTIKDGQGMVSTGPYRIEGEFVVNGEFLSFDSISGNTSLTGSGRVRVQ